MRDFCRPHPLAQKIYSPDYSKKNLSEKFAGFDANRIFATSIIRVAIALLIMIFPMYTKAQITYRIVNSSINEKLSSISILAMENEEQGGFWIATLGGLNYFDGNSMKEYRSYKQGKNYIGSSNITNIITDGAGETLVTTLDAGLLKHNKAKDSFYPLLWNERSPLLKKNIRASLKDTSGDIWVGYEDGGITQLRMETQEAKHYQTSSASGVTDIFQSSSGTVYFSTKARTIQKYSNTREEIDEFRPIEACEGLTDNIEEISTSNDIIFWLGTRGHGLLKLDLEKMHCSRIDLPSPAGLRSSEANIYHIYLSGSDFWIASDQGIYRLDNKELKIYYFNSGTSDLNDNEVTSIMRTKNGRTWVGTYGGLNTVIKSSFKLHSASSSPEISSVVAISSSLEMGTWIATYNGIYHFDEGKNNHIPIETAIPTLRFLNERVMSLSIATHNMWIGYRSNGLELFNHKNNTVTKYTTKTTPMLSSNSVSAILPLESGETIIGTFGGGLNVLNGDNTVDFYRKDHSERSLKHDNVIMLFRSSNGTIWIGTEGGLQVFELSSREFFPVEVDLELENIIIWSITEDSSGKLWAGSMHHGLFNLSSSEGQHNAHLASSIKLEMTEPISTIYSIEAGSAGRLWLATNRGLTRIDPVSGGLDYFTQELGFSRPEFDVGASHRDSAGNLYFGGSQGYNKFNPADIEVNSTPSRVILTGLNIAGQTPAVGIGLEDIEEVILSHEDYFVTFLFSVLDFLDPNKNQYRYKLEGFDPQWIENGTRSSATYTNLPPGSYVLRVQGANSAGVWNREGFSLDITVLPAPWFSWWAYCAYGLLLLFLMWLGKKYYDTYKLKMQANLLVLEMTGTADKAMDDLQEQLEYQDEFVKSSHQHSVYTLALIRDFSTWQQEGIDDVKVLEQLTANQARVAALMRLQNYLYFDNELLVADLHQYTDSIIGELKNNATVPPESIITINDIPQTVLDGKLASLMAIALYELLKNCFQHAFKSGTTANYIHIKMELEPNTEDTSMQVIVSVEDNGIGIPPARPNHSSGASGLAIVSAIGTALSGSVDIQCTETTKVSIQFAYEDIRQT